MWRCGKEAAGDSGQGRMCRESLDTAYTIPMDDDLTVACLGGILEIGFQTLSRCCEQSW